MKIAFLQETVNQNIGIMQLSAVLKSAGHDCEVFVEPFEKAMLKAVQSYAPDIAGFSVITGTHQIVLHKASLLKRLLPKTPVILGGPHPTYFPEIINEPAVDLVARGEAEISFPEVLNRMQNKKDYTNVQGIWVKKNGNVYRNEVPALVEDLATLPFPDHRLYQKYGFYRVQTEAPFVTIRGCPFHCSFCYNHLKARLYKNKGQYVRLRPVENIINEMEMCREFYPKMRSVVFHNDIIGIDKKWLEDFCQAYSRRINLPWFTSIRADSIDEFVVAQLKKARCFCLSIGVETGNEYLRSHILGKKISNQQYLKAAALVHGAGIKVRTSNMFFLPGENLEKAIETVDLNRKMHADFAWAYTLQPYPNTDIHKYAVKNGYLSANFGPNDIDPLGLIKPLCRTKDMKKIFVVQRFFHFFVHSKVAHKLLRFLIHFPPNPIFDMFLYFSLIKNYAEYHNISFFRALYIAWFTWWGTRKFRNASTDE